MLRWRLILGPILVALLFGACWLDYRTTRPGAYLLPIAAVVSMLGAGELLAMFRRRAAGLQPLPWAVCGGTLITVLTAGAPVWLPINWNGGDAVGKLGWLAIGLVGSLLLAIIGEMRRYEGAGRATENLALTCLAVTYAGGLMGFLVQLRMLGSGESGNDARLGMLALASAVLIVKLSDTGQYTAGRLFGAHKLAPKISPGKTWEGVCGGMLFAILGAFLTTWLGRQMGVEAFNRLDSTTLGSACFFFIYPLSIAAAGIVGDLAESMLKRDAGVKDSSDWLPGFGGVLDMLDSLLGAAPVAYVFWVVWLVCA